MKKLIPLVLLIVMVFTAGCDLASGPVTISTSGQQPAINSFDASPESISAGESSTLSWSVSGASTVSIDQGIGNVALTGRRAVMPSATTVYTLTATNAAGKSTTATAQVMVSGAPSSSAGLPVVNSFTASPSGITVGSPATLSWNVSNATSVTINPGVGTFASSRTTIVLPSVNTTYTLTATNAAGSTTATAQVTVSGAGPSPSAGQPVVNYFTATPDIIASGDSTTLSWDVSNATSVTIDPGVGAVDLVGTAVVSPPASTNYTLTATNAAWVYYRTIPVLVTGMPSADTTPPSVPALLSPSNGATMPQPSSAWTFDWADSADPESGISQYQLYVIHTGSLNPAIDVYVINSSYSQTLGGSIAPSNLTNWRWRVRAQNNVGLWSAWSADRLFDVQAP
jgi:hypothetical protein